MKTGKFLLSGVVAMSTMLFSSAVLSGCSCWSVPVPRNATLKTNGGPLIQAHRGGRAEYDDNAAGGFAKCIAKGVRGFETDIRFSKDSRLVIMHDESLDRTTTGTGIVEETTFEDMRKLKLKKSGEPIPSLHDIFRALGERDDIFIELEMKAYPGEHYPPERLEDYCRALYAAAYLALKPGTYAFTCFNETTLETMRRVAPDAPLGYITGEWLSEKHIETARRIGCASVAPRLGGTTKEMIDAAHDAGLSVCCWMVQDESELREAREKGADRVTSDHPMKLLDLTRRP